MSEYQSNLGRPLPEAALVVSGGDGTLFHVLNRLKPPYPPIVIVPAGRGNALARDLRDYRGFVSIDLMKVDARSEDGAEHTYICGSSVALGYPYTVTERAVWFRRLRRLSYAAATLITVPSRGEYRASFNDAAFETMSLSGILVNNTKHVGGFVALPDASVCDGQLDAMQTRSGYVSQMAHNVSSMARLHLWMPAKVTRFTRASLSVSRPQPLMLDGELLPPVVELTVEVLPGALQCRALAHTGESS